ncbi:MAG: hypothetical protein PHH37_02325 [Paludibacter sp.]|nr:hypothetical protein [Paludibacter sp.]
MRNRLLIALLYNIIFFTALAADVSKPKQLNNIIKIVETDSNIYQNRYVRMKKLLQHVPRDTNYRKAVLFNKNFKNKYLDEDDFHYNEAEENFTIIERFFNKIAKLFKRLLGLAPNAHIDTFNLLIIKMLSVIIILVVIYFLVRIYLKNNLSKLINKKNEPVEIDINNAEQLIEEANFGELIREAEQNGNTRISIRLYYLWLLKTLRNRQIINWLPEKTNSEYFYEISDPQIKKVFSELSYLYDYIWYGEFSINDEEYLKAKNAYQKFITGKGINS